MYQYTYIFIIEGYIEEGIKKCVNESNIYGARGEGGEICVGVKDRMPSRSRSISSPKSITWGHGCD